MKKSTAPISFAGSQLGALRHICAFFSSEDEEYRVLLPFVREGFECGDKAVHIISPDDHNDHLARLVSAGIDTTTAQESGQLEIKGNREAYLRDGTFDQDRMLATFEQLMSGNADEAFPLSRILCRMDWPVEDQSRFADVIEFESRVNDLWSRHDDVVICTYPIGRCGGSAIIDILRTHPLVILGGILQHNPFFTPPEVFLAERRAKRRDNSATRAD